jgi:hypothetical protein
VFSVGFNRLELLGGGFNPRRVLLDLNTTAANLPIALSRNHHNPDRPPQFNP